MLFYFFLLSHLPKIYQSFLMSATLSEDVQALKELLLHNPVCIQPAQLQSCYMGLTFSLTLHFMLPFRSSWSSRAHSCQTALSCSSTASGVRRRTSSCWSTRCSGCGWSRARHWCLLGRWTDATGSNSSWSSLAFLPAYSTQSCLCSPGRASGVGNPAVQSCCSGSDVGSRREDFDCCRVPLDATSSLSSTRASMTTSLPPTSRVWPTPPLLLRRLQPKARRKRPQRQLQSESVEDFPKMGLVFSFTNIRLNLVMSVNEGGF